MDFRQRLLGPTRVPATPLEQIRGTVSILGTGEHPAVRQAADQGYSVGYIHGYQGWTPAVNLDPTIKLAPLRLGLSARLIGKISPPPPVEQVRNTLGFLHTGADPSVTQAGQAAYQHGYIQGAADRPVILRVDVIRGLRGG